MDDRVPAVIKADREGLFVLIDPSAEWPAVMQALRKRLEATPHFFRGAAVRLYENGIRVGPKEKADIIQLFEEFQVTLLEAKSPAPPAKRRDADRRQDSDELPERDAGLGESTGEAERTLLIRRTLRSGQSVTFDGNVVVLGDVNPGAEVICTGDILVLGALRGVAHAGAEGNEDAVVVAFRLEPTQLRIAGHISRSPDGDAPRPEGPELARVKDRMIQVEAYSP